ncbi:hypothetical protein CASFOL_010713 [Castilleja foliolosa]|uniref:KIB1-4 beta-propeller domain-containing protein n=1 Tax=Castilleja foliolosa TaxID=1961234 RepID=A0ABD3DTD9_9LAMI
MAPSIFSSSPKLILRLLSIFKSPISVRTMTTTTTTVTTPSPCLMLPPTFVGDNMVYNFYNLAQNKVLNFNTKKLDDTRVVGSSHGWLALFNQRNSDLTLTNPVTCRHVNLPPPNKSDVSSGIKVIISCDAEHEDCQAMMICDLAKLFFCRPNHSPTEWTHIGEPRGNGTVRCYEDVVYSSRHKMFFCVATTGYDDLEAWDVASDPPRLVWENKDDLLNHENYKDFIYQEEALLIDGNGERIDTDRYKYLVFVEQMDQLFLVTRHIVHRMAPDGSSTEEGGYDDYPYKTVSFNVHKIDWELEGGGGRLSHMDGGSLDGLAIFIGLNHSFAVLASESNGLKPDSIYFTNDKEFTPCNFLDRKYGGHDIGIFDYETKTISPCYYPCDVKSLKKIAPEPMWFTLTLN